MDVSSYPLIFLAFLSFVPYIGFLQYLNQETVSIAPQPGILGLMLALIERLESRS